MFDGSGPVLASSPAVTVRTFNAGPSTAPLYGYVVALVTPNRSVVTSARGFALRSPYL